MEARRDAQHSGKFLNDATDWLDTLQGWFLGLGDPKGNPGVENRTQWMINKVGI